MSNIGQRIALVLFIFLSAQPIGFCAEDNQVKDYFRTIADKCLGNYFQSPVYVTGIATESFILNNDGSVSQITIIKHPRHFKTNKISPLSDKALVSALKCSAPFPPPPPSLRTPVRLVLSFKLWNPNKPDSVTVDFYQGQAVSN